jgi:phage FluMu protein Com
MKELRCSKCGKLFDDTHMSCPNCGNPADKNISTEKSNVSTTDTGYQYELTIKRYADVVLTISQVMAVMIAVGITLSSVWMMINGLRSGMIEGVGFSLLIIAFGLLIAWSVYIIGLLTRSFLYVYINISINIHEINMKTQ